MTNAHPLNTRGIINAMSMSPPPLSPDPYASYPPAGPGGHRAGLRAAVAVWVSAGLLLLFSTCCVGVIAMVGVLPMDQLRQADQSGQVPAEMWDQLGQAQPYIPLVAGGLALVTVLPAVVLLILGFSVKTGKRGATLAALVLSIVALAGVGLFAVLSAVGSLQSGQIDICSLSLFGGLAACLGWSVVSLKKALAVASDPGSGDVFQPMHQHHGPQNFRGDGRSVDDDPWENSL